MARTFPGALVPAVNPDGSIQWQNWQYDELLAHLSSDLQIDPATDLLGGVVLVSPAGLRLVYGTVNVTNGLSASVSHGLGRVPVAVCAIPDRQGVGVAPPYLDMNQSPTATTLTIAATGGTGATVYKVWWMAIG